MVSVFWKQFWALVRKNWIILRQHPILNIVRCFLLPIAYGVFLAFAKLFLTKPNNYGLGSPVPIKALQDQYTGLETFVWADVTTNQTSPSPNEIMSAVTSTFTPTQLSSIKKVSTILEVVTECPQNINLYSECWAAVVFSDSDEVGSLNYTILADGGLRYINVIDHTSDYEEVILPLQWAVDRAIIQLATSREVPTPLELPFSHRTNEQQSDDIRTSFIRGTRQLLILAFVVAFVGISFQLPGGFANERSSLLTSHMKAMGLSDWPRILSWHISVSLAYLPAWMIISVIWWYRLWTLSSLGLVIFIHVIFGLLLASYAIFVAVPFASRSPQLAAVASTFMTLLWAIVAVALQNIGTCGAVVYSIIFPPGFYIFVMRALAGWENSLLDTKVAEGDPDTGLVALPIIIAGIIDIFLWPYLAILLERRLYDARYPAETQPWLSRLLPWREPYSSRSNVIPENVPTNTAISIRNLNKAYPSSSLSPFSKKKDVTAISSLTLNIPRTGIFVLLGSNGSGKSTLMSVLAGILGPTQGEVIFTASDGKENTMSSDVTRDGSIGIVPQKNVLFPELTCLQTLKVWRAIKSGYRNVGENGEEEEDDLEQLLRDCDIGEKTHEISGQMSGGQKRKLQLAVGLVGGSNILLVDECTSGVDPLSRRALWRTLTAVRHKRAIIFTTHFLDEADLLADHIAILAAPGRLVADGSPVKLKQELGSGYDVTVSFNAQGNPEAVLNDVREVAPNASLTNLSDSRYAYHLAEKDNVVVSKVLKKIEEGKVGWGIDSYDLVGSTIEGIFLDLMKAHDNPDSVERSEEDTLVPDQTSEREGKFSDAVALLPHGTKSSSFRQALIIMHKRFLIFKRSWLISLLAVLIVVLGATVPLVFMDDRQQSCVRKFRGSSVRSLYLPVFYQKAFTGSPLLLISPPGILQSLPGFNNVTISPPNILQSLPGFNNTIKTVKTRNIVNNSTFLEVVQQSYLDLDLGGVVLDESSLDVLIAWEANPPGNGAPVLLNLASNLVLQSATNGSRSTISLIRTNYAPFPLVNSRNLVALKWVGFYALALAVFPSFFALYVSQERKVTLVQAMQFSNGLSNPAGLWMGHLAFDSIFTVISMTIILLVFATASNQFNGLGFLWCVMILYGITGTLFAYCISLLGSSPLAAFAMSAGYHALVFTFYLTAYLLTFTYAKPSETDGFINIIHWTMSWLSPIGPLVRASFVSVNLFGLLCSGEDMVSPSALVGLKRYGGPLLYLFIYPFFLFAILVWVDSGSTILSRLRFKTKTRSISSISSSYLLEEIKTPADPPALLKVIDITKRFGENTVVDNVSLGVPRDVTMALLGPNGAGKTTTFNIIRGDILPEPGGSVLINGVSVIHHPQKARLSLGICPQFTPIDTQLTVRQHLLIYGRLKGLNGTSLKTSIDVLLRATGLHIYAERLASKLSGGNQRKVALCIAMIGNPPVILIDEFSTGVDARMRREMWRTLRIVARGKAVIITTHSMEEAAALSNQVAIIAKKVLAIGSPDELTARYPSYEVHFSCRNRQEVLDTQRLMAQIPGAKMADDVATRFEVPLSSGDGEKGDMTLSRLFSLLASDDDAGGGGGGGGPSEYTVEKVGLESVFLKVIKGNRVSEDRPKTRSWTCW